MKFRTEYEAQTAKFTLSTDKPVVLVGSCFSQNIASRMNAHLWRAINPLGTLYNPFSIAMAIDTICDEKKGEERFEKSLFQYNGLWNSYRFDSSFSSSNKDDCVEEFRLRRKEFTDTLAEGGALILTFGTAIYYKLVKEDLPVSNCHKLPAENFITRRLTVAEVASYCDVVIEQLREMYPELKIILTVSPVRHLKNGFVGNSRSKAVLQLGVEDIICYNENCVYFPAFEILNDDLRDYRFYASDMLHPSEEGIQYIWEKFLDTFVDRDGRERLAEGLRKFKAGSHRPLTGALGKELRGKY